MMTDTRLRIAILATNPYALKPWAQRLAERICTSGHLDLCALLSPATRVAGPSGNPLFRAWRSLESRAAAKPAPVVCPSFDDLKTGLPVLNLSERTAVEDLNLDIILDLTGDFGQSTPVAFARHGVWFLDFVTASPGFAALHAIIDNAPVTTLALFQRTAGTSEPAMIAQAAVNTKFIAARNDLFMAEKSVALILRELRRLQQTGTVQAIEGAGFTAPKPPGVLHMARYLCGLVAESFGRVMEILLTKLRLRPGMFFLKTIEGDILSFDPAAAAPHIADGNEYFADPYLWQHGGETYCFFEVYDYATAKGHLSVGRLDEGKLVDIRVALKADYHLSFPFLFEEEGTLYMMPETCGAERLEIWRCVSFPDQWEQHSTALEGMIAADSSLARIDGKWWLFTNISTDPFGEMNSELHLYQVDGPALKSLTPHPLNPVVFDARTARNAGRILERDGVLYRPSQDNSHGVYGYGVNLMRIDTLTPDSYSETLVRKIEPDFEKGIMGCHHLDQRGGLIVMDVRKRIGGR